MNDQPTTTTTTSASATTIASAATRADGNLVGVTKAVNTLHQSKRKKGKRVGRRRRGKKDVILDFTKRAKKPATKDSTDHSTCGVAAAVVATSSSGSNRRTTPNDEDSLSVSRSQTKKAKGKLNLVTSSRDYGGNLGLPEKVAQREYETTGQFFRRLNRLVAKAKVEASLESRFDMTLVKSQEQSSSNPDCDTTPKVEHKLNKNKRAKR